MSHDGRDRFRGRVRALPGLLAGASDWTVLLCGIAVTALGVLIVTRPLTSLLLLGLYSGISCIITGTAELLEHRHATRRTDIMFAILWIAAGVAILAWMGRSIEELPALLAVLLVFSSLDRFTATHGGGADERALAWSFGLAELTFGVFALSWPDLTLIVVAVLFGVRTIVYGASLLWRSGRAILGRRAARHEVPMTPAATEGRGGPTAAARWTVAARWAAAVAVLALAAGLLLLSHTMRHGIPVLDDFYDAPDEIPPQPGMLLRSEPYEGELPDGVSAWRILYTTTLWDGEDVLASAVVAGPTSMSTEPRPVIAWAHGTVGIANACAPSLTPSAITPAAIPALDAIVRNGWIVVATDYAGLGTDGDTPYLVGEGEARSVLDSVRAARRLPELRLADETVVWGHSQGGHAALWTAQIAPGYAPDVDVMGTAALAPATDLVAISDDISTKGPLAGILMSFMLSTYSRYYDDVRLDRYISPSARRMVREIAARCPAASAAGIRADTLVSLLGLIAVSRDRPIFNVDFTGGPLIARLSENVPLGPFRQPLFLGQGESDEVAAIGIQNAYVASQCASGQALEYRTYPGRTHMGLLEGDSPLPADLEQWTKDRLAGSPSPDTCAR